MFSNQAGAGGCRGLDADHSDFRPSYDLQFVHSLLPDVRLENSIWVLVFTGFSSQPLS